MAKQKPNGNIILIIIIALIIITTCIIAWLVIKSKHDADDFYLYMPEKPSIPELPTKDELYTPLWNTKVAKLSLYFNDLQYYLFSRDLLDLSSLSTSSALNLFNQSMPDGAKAVNMFTSSCPSILGISDPVYMGVAIEYLDTTFIVIRGSMTKCEWGEDAKAYKKSPSWIPDKYNVWVHGGFDNIYTYDKLGYPSLRNQILNYISVSQPKNLIITGHSLGAAIAYFLSADMTLTMPKMRMYTKYILFGGPYTGNKSFVNLIMSGNPRYGYSGIFSVVNTKDIVPNIYISSGWHRVPIQQFCFSKSFPPFSHYPKIYDEALDEYGKEWEQMAKDDRAISNGTCDRELLCDDKQC